MVPWGACVVAQPPAWISPFLTSLVSFFSPTHTTPSADPARVLNMPPVIYVPVGIHGYIRCPVDAEPPATVVKWNKDGRPLQVEKVLERCMRGPNEMHPPDPKMLPLGVWFPARTPPLATKTSGKAKSCFPWGSAVRQGTEQPRPQGNRCSV